MAERASVFQATQLGVESVKGTSVAANKRLLATMFRLTPVVPREPFRPMGSKAHTTVVKQKEHTEGDIEGVVAYGDMVYLLSGLLEAAAITTPTGATNARRWAFKPLNFGVDDYVTFTIETGTDSNSFAEKCTYGLINGLTVRFSREEASVSGDVVARETQEAIDMTNSPTDIAEFPVDPKEVSIFIGDAMTNEVQTFDLGAASAGTFTITATDPVTGATETSGNINYNDNAAAVQTALLAMSMFHTGDVVATGGALPGTPVVLTFGGRFAGINMAEITIDDSALTDETVTIDTTTEGGMSKLTRCLEFEWSLTDRFNQQFTLDAAFESFSAEVEKAPEHNAQMILQHDATSQALMAQLRDGTTKFVKLIAYGANIESGFNREIHLSFPCKLIETEREDQDDVWASTYNMQPIYNSTFGGFVEWVIYNNLAAL